MATYASDTGCGNCSALLSLNAGALELNISTSDLIHARDNVEDCRLTRAVRPNECTNLTLIDVEVDGIKSFDATKLHSDFVEFKNLLAHYFTSESSVAGAALEIFSRF